MNGLGRSCVSLWDGIIVYRLAMGLNRDTPMVLLMLIILPC